MDNNFAKMARAIAFIQQNSDEQPGLASIAEHVGLSPHHFQRVFSRYVGVSPKRFMENLTVSRAREMLRESRSVLETAVDLGLSGPSRLHDHFITLDAMTPGEYKNLGAGLDIRYGIHPGPFGDMLVGITGRGVCWLSFVDEGDSCRALAEMQEQWPASRVSHVPEATARVARQMFTGPDSSLNLLVKGTNFQVNVWRALLNIPPGRVVSYKTVARAAGRPAAIRAAANAIATNSIAWLIPCHRVLRENGAPGGYRWGVDRKRALLALEAGRNG